MASSLNQIIERVFRAVAPGSSQESTGVSYPDIEAFFTDAGIQLARQAVDGDPLARQYLTKSWTVALSGGNYPVSGASYFTLEIRSLPLATVTHADSAYPLVYLPDPGDLYFPQPGENSGGGFIHYTVENEAIRTRNQSGTVDGLTGSLTLRNAIFRPRVDNSGTTDLPEQLEDAFVALVADMVRAKMGAGAPQGAA